MPSIIIVLGMHKSGTTLVSEILDGSGIPMIEGSDARTYDQGNHFERTATNALNKTLLQCGEQSSLRVITPYRRSGDDAGLRARAHQIIDQVETGACGDWGFKDPRTCLTYPFWADLLPHHKLVCVYRSAASVRAHYASRKRHSLTRGVKALRAWVVYNRSMLDAYANMPAGRRIILSYEALMNSDDEIRRLEAFVGRQLVDRRSQALRRQSQTQGARMAIESRYLGWRYGLEVSDVSRQLERAYQTEIIATNGDSA